jgi:hypothetical protein
MVDQGTFESSARLNLKLVDLASNLYQRLLDTKCQCLHFEPKSVHGVVLADRLLNALGGLLMSVESKLNACHQIGHSCPCASFPFLASTIPGWCVILSRMLPWVAVRVFHDVTADDLGVALVPSPVELGDELAVDGHPWPLEAVELVWAPPGARVAAIVKVRAAVLHAV